MIEVIPSIVVQTVQGFEQRLRKVEPYVSRVHLDIVDGKFADNTTITGYEELFQIETNVKVGVHLMVMKPEDQMHHWYTTKAERFSVHIESTDALKDIIAEAHANKRKIGVALNPETPCDAIRKFVDSVDYVHFMTVHPGFYGGEFLEDVVEKISQFHGEFPNIPIVVDGGINPHTAKKVVAAGASELIVGTDIFNSPDIRMEIEQLKNL